MPSRRTFLKWLLVGGAAVSLPLLLHYTRRPPCSLASLSIIPRSEWGAAEPDHTVTGEHGLYHPQTNPEGWLVYPEPLEQVFTTIVVHHSALPVSDGPLAIQRLHMVNRGFADIVLLGNFENSPPLPIQLTTLQTLAGCLAAAYNITHLAGHRDFQPGVTVCPGQFLEPLLPGLAARLGLSFGTAGYNGPL
jgi:hypothetical protein